MDGPTDRKHYFSMKATILPLLIIKAFFMTVLACLLVSVFVVLSPVLIVYSLNLAAYSKRLEREVKSRC